ncbi:MAG: tRNA epoxyqueuosine(34) reductase QueG [Gemmatimonadota bacterium]
MTGPAELTRVLRAACRAEGIDKVGVARADATGEAFRLEAWLERGYQAGMAWMERWAEKRVDPRELVPGARSVVSVALNYYAEAPREPRPEEGRVARYAWGEDYHRVLKDKLRAVLARLREADRHLGGRAFVDTAPIQEKLWAERCGVGWRGKHSNVVTTDLGSWIYLGELVLDRELLYDAPHADHCGSCTRCLDACPTGAIVEPYVVDASRCLSYLTIEHRGEVDARLAAEFQEWVFGCDVCQEVCPWNRKHAKPGAEPRLEPRAGQFALDLEETAGLEDAEFHRRFADAALERARPEGLRRNAALLLARRAVAADAGGSS